ncbi:Protein of unknown function [Gryllus bimaculatus]|nr:Protein of unknown function [Gryllus bimaculatus]
MSEYVITSTVSGTRYCSTISAMLQEHGADARKNALYEGYGFISCKRFHLGFVFGNAL